MRPEIAKVWGGIEAQAFAGQKAFEEKAEALFRTDPAAARRLLTEYSVKTAEDAVAAYRRLERDLWAKFNYQF
jgi:dipeptidase